MTLRYKLGLGVLALAGIIVGGCSARTGGSNPIASQ